MPVLFTAAVQAAGMSLHKPASTPVPHSSGFCSDQGSFGVEEVHGEDAVATTASRSSMSKTFARVGGDQYREKGV